MHLETISIFLFNQIIRWTGTLDTLGSSLTLCNLILVCLRNHKQTADLLASGSLYLGLAFYPLDLFCMCF